MALACLSPEPATSGYHFAARSHAFQALARTGQRSASNPHSNVIALARQLEPGLEDEDFADTGRRLDRLSDKVFARYGLGPEDIAQLRKRFAAWPRS